MRNTARIFTAITAPLLLLCMSPVAGAAEDDNKELQALINELQEQIERAEEQRLADPWFLRDLRELLRGYENPWQRQILHDDFSGRERTPADPWRVTAGEFLIDWRHGLRSVVEPPRQAARQSRKGDEVERLFGALLDEALGTGGRQGSGEAGYAAVLAPVSISNAFAIEIRLSSRLMDRPGGAFAWGPYQGDDIGSGYRLVYTPDPVEGVPPLALRRFTPRGSSTLEFHDAPVDLEDDQVHNLRWTRDGDGNMIVRLDGEQVIQVRDRGFREAFDGFAMINRGGDYSIREITIAGPSR